MHWEEEEEEAGSFFLGSCDNDAGGHWCRTNLTVPHAKLENGGLNQPCDENSGFLYTNWHYCNASNPYYAKMRDEKEEDEKEEEKEEEEEEDVGKEDGYGYGYGYGL